MSNSKNKERVSTNRDVMNRKVSVTIIHKPQEGITKPGIGLFVESNDETHFFALKIRNVIGGSQRAVAFRRNVTFIGRSGKGQDFVLDNPVQVAVLCWERRWEEKEKAR